jgi:DNA-binding NarL/FixJ family response regulator
MVKVVVAENNDSVRKMMADIVLMTPGFKLLFQAVDGFDLLSNLNRSRELPDVVILQVQMPVMDGLSVANFLLDKYRGISICCISNHVNHKLAEEFFEIGAEGFILKSLLSQKVFQLAMAAIKDRKRYLQIDQVPVLIDSIKQITHTEKPVSLSLNEKIFLQLSATHFSYAQIAGLMNVAEPTLFNYQKSLKEKLGLRNRHEFILYALQHGIARVARY